MKMPRLFVTAGLVVAALGVSTSANAQRYDNSPQTSQRDHSADRGDNSVDRRDNSIDQRDNNTNRRDNSANDNGRRYNSDRRYSDVRRHYGWNRGRHYSGGNRRCWTEWRHHQRVRLCR